MSSVNPYQSPQANHEADSPPRPASSGFHALSIAAICIVAVGVHLALREIAINSQPFLGYVHYIPPAVAIVTCICWNVFRWAQPSVLATLFVGSIFGLLSCVQLLVEIGNSIGEYWVWSRDWPQAIMYFATYAAIGAVVGLIVAGAFWGVRWGISLLGEATADRAD